MATIDTAATRLLGIDVPIVQAGMSWASSDWRLPLAVSRAGGLGVIAAGPMRLPDLEHAIAAVREGTDAPFAVNVPLYRTGVEEVLDLVHALAPPVLIGSQGGPHRYLERFQNANTKWLHVVAGTEHAVKAVRAGVDGLIVVGVEAGGHPSPSGVSTLVIVQAISRQIGQVPVIAAGGFIDGAGLAAALALGADGAQFGTRFLASFEANVHPAYKEAVLTAEVEDTRAVGRGFGIIRALKNEFTDRMVQLEQSGADLELRRAAFAEASLKMAALDGDVANGKVEAGQSAGLIRELLPAHEIVRRIVEEYGVVVEGLPRVDERSC